MAIKWCERCKTNIARHAATLCWQCKELDNPETLRHNHFLRCPKCKHVWFAHDVWESSIYEKGEHELTCLECDHDFTVETQVSYSFKSPAMEEK